MKTDLFSSIGLAIAGTLIAYFLCNFLAGQIFEAKDISIKTVDSNVSADLEDPNPEVFNYKSLDPTVEVYVGDCTGDDCTEVSSDEIIDIGIDTQGNQ